MNNLSVPEVTKNLDQLIDQITENYQPVIIKGTKNEVVMISTEDWSAIQETIYLNSILKCQKRTPVKFLNKKSRTG